MPLLKYTASADTTITDAYKPNTTNRAYYANMGAADSLEIFSVYHSGSSPERTRILVRFPVAQISESRTSGILPASGNVNFIFKLYNVQHPETLPKNYDVLIKPISGSWDEGYGLDLENYNDNGQTIDGGYGVGWKFKSTTDVSEVWSSDGGDFYVGYDKTYHFDEGTEDLEVDVTDIVEDQIAGNISADGFAVMLSGSFEDGTNFTNYYTKRFSARSSEYFYKVPRLEARWESTIRDDRGNFHFASNNLEDSDNIQNIYFYNKINGTIKNLPSDITPFVKILDDNNTILTSSIPTAKVSTGVYRASFKITGSSDQELVDVWYSGSAEYYTGSVNCKVRVFDDTFVENEKIFTLTNLKQTYKNFEKPTIRVFGRHKNWSPNIYKISTSDIETLTFNNLYYKVYRIVDGETIIDYGIDPIPFTKCSYDKNGNYFDLDMAFFQPGYSYGIKLMLVNGGTREELKNVYKFKVE